jgi:hypothetical protein
MNQAFFNRVARLSIGEYVKGALNTVVTVSTPLRITFDISKTEFSAPNMAKITINNLSSNTRNKINQDRKQVAVLEAGYVDAGGLQLLFHGDIVDVSHDLKKPEILTTITVMDGHNAIKEKKISVSYRAGAPISQVIKDCTKALGLPMSASYNYVQLPTSSLDATASFTGNAAIWLDRICNDNGLQWSIQNGTIKIVNAEKSDNLPPLSSVLIGSPRRLFKNMITQSLTDFSGYEFDALLMPKCEPFSAIELISRDIPKPIKLVASEVKHSGDNFGDKWQTTVKARDGKWARI